MTFNPINPTDADHIKMMSEPNLWPRWPILPIKKYVAGRQLADTAVLVNCSLSDNRVRFTEGNMWSLSNADVYNTWQNGPVADPVALVAAGWVVD
jgi:hypothetical protein